MDFSWMRSIEEIPRRVMQYQGDRQNSAAQGTMNAISMISFVILSTVSIIVFDCITAWVRFSFAAV